MTMIERVARAIYEESDWSREQPWGNLPNAHRVPYLADAKAAIEAMRDPTRDMYKSANDALVPALDASACWDAMIDAALREGEIGKDG